MKTKKEINANAANAIVQALKNGKVVECSVDGGESWKNFDHLKYRITEPKPKIKPYTYEELKEAVKKHGILVEEMIKGVSSTMTILGFDGYHIKFDFVGVSGMSLLDFSRQFVWLDDGSPCGVPVDEKPEEKEESKKDTSEASTVDLSRMTSEERLNYWKKKVGLTGETGREYDFFPVTEKDYDKLYEALEKNASEFLSEEDREQRLSEFKGGFGGETFSLYVLDDDGDLPTMELEFMTPDWNLLPVDLQVACCEIAWACL